MRILYTKLYFIATITRKTYPPTPVWGNLRRGLTTKGGSTPKEISYAHAGKQDLTALHKTAGMAVFKGFLYYKTYKL